MMRSTAGHRALWTCGAEAIQRVWPRHWKPRYILDRSLNVSSYFVHRDRPWFTPQAVRFLERWLKRSDSAFEWGSGRSTLWLARRVRRIVSVEHDLAWFQEVQSKAIAQGLENVQLQLSWPEAADHPKEEYVQAIEQCDDSFDLVIVDGLHRDRCALTALPRLKPTGLLLVDNANWYLPSRSRSPSSRSERDGPVSPEWAEFALRVGGFRSVWTTNGVWDTAIWVKPSAAQ